MRSNSMLGPGGRSGGQSNSKETNAIPISPRWRRRKTTSAFLQSHLSANLAQNQRSVDTLFGHSWRLYKMYNAADIQTGKQPEKGETRGKSFQGIGHFKGKRSDFESSNWTSLSVMGCTHERCHSLFCCQILAQLVTRGRGGEPQRVFDRMGNGTCLYGRGVMEWRVL